MCSDGRWRVLGERVGYTGAPQFRGWLSAEDRVIQGVVNASYEAIVTIPLQGREGRTRDIEAVVDAGYSGFLTLPPSSVEVQPRRGFRCRCPPACGPPRNPVSMFVVATLARAVYPDNPSVIPCTSHLGSCRCRRVSHPRERP